MIDITKLNNRYADFKENGFDEKYLNYQNLISYLSKHNFDKQVIGESFLGQHIYKLSIGKGKKRVLIWSQMHGNESTGTRAMMDVWNFLNNNSEDANFIKDNLTIDYIPMLNPDGANVYTRRNAVGIDINRDFVAQQSTEIHLLINQVKEGDYDVLFNLHDQRTIFNVGETREPATLSFLAPSYNKEEDINDVREKTMGIIQAMNEELQKVIKGKIGRYSSEFYPRSTGDNFTKMGYPTVLFEAGHYPNDYQRNETRKYNALAIITGLYSISENTTLPFNEYDTIPQNGQKFVDILIKNVSLKRKDKISVVDIAIQYEDFFDEATGKVQTKLKIKEIGDLSYIYGHQEYDATNDLFESYDSDYPKLESVANFKIGNLKFISKYK